MGASAFLEGVQLAFVIGMDQVKLIYGHIDRDSHEHAKLKNSVSRLDKLRNEIMNLQNAYAVSYRPEKPNFDTLISESEMFAEGVFKPMR